MTSRRRHHTLFTKSRLTRAHESIRCSTDSCAFWTLHVYSWKRTGVHVKENWLMRQQRALSIRIFETLTAKVITRWSTVKFDTFTTRILSWHNHRLMGHCSVKQDEAYEIATPNNRLDTLPSSTYMSSLRVFILVPYLLMPKNYRRQDILEFDYIRIYTTQSK